MAQAESNNPILKQIGNVRQFNHVAMATTFEIFIVHEDGLYAQQAAEAAFAEVDKLEKEFSRFIENSDISQVRNLRAHQSMRLGIDSFRCLSLSQLVCKDTSGTFDISVGALMNCWFDKERNPRHPSKEEVEAARHRTGCGIFKLDEGELSIEVMTDNVEIDLGAVGKGYAVDKIGELLREWDIKIALINGGDSSVLALEGPEKFPGWPVTLSSADNKVLAKLYLKNRSVSGSGVQKGKHIINPWTGQPVEDKLNTWSAAPDAAMADALSTAFMVMKPQDIEQYCLKHTDTQAMIISAAGKKAIRYGDWPGLSGNGTADGA